MLRVQVRRLTPPRPPSSPHFLLMSCHVWCRRKRSMLVSAVRTLPGGMIGIRISLVNVLLTREIQGTRHPAETRGHGDAGTRGKTW